MSKRLLVISSSPRKNGNSDILCDEFVKGARASGHDAEKVFLGEKKIEFCTACEYCTSHNGVCIKKDDMADLLQKMIDADVIVMATPVYFYTMSAQLKTFIDRTMSRYTEISNKDFYFIVTAADGDESSLERTVEGLRGFTDCCLDNPREKGIIYASGVWHKGDIKRTLFMKQAYDMGKNI